MSTLGRYWQIILTVLSLCLTLLALTNCSASPPTLGEPEQTREAEATEIAIQIEGIEAARIKEISTGTPNGSIVSEPSPEKEPQQTRDVEATKISIQEIRRTREAEATEVSIQIEGTEEARIASISSRAPEGTIVSDPLPDGNVHNNDLVIGFLPLPPVGGPHNGTWQKCGRYDDPVFPRHAIHSMEHGAVWVSYDPSLSEDAVDQLFKAVEGETYILLSPYPGLQSAVVLTAWGVQLEVDSAEDDRIEEFLKAYVNGPQTPEPEAGCATGTTDTDVPVEP